MEWNICVYIFFSSMNALDGWLARLRSATDPTQPFLLIVTAMVIHSEQEQSLERRYEKLNKELRSLLILSGNVYQNYTRESY